MEAKGSQTVALLGLCWISVALRGVAPSASGECYFNAKGGQAPSTAGILIRDGQQGAAQCLSVSGCSSVSQCLRVCPSVSVCEQENRPDRSLRCLSDLQIVSDTRRRSDLQWFWSRYPDRCRTVRVEAAEQTRRERGWQFTAGVDDAESECGLDGGVAFDWTIHNDSGAQRLEEQLGGLLSLARERAGV
nr:PREDICTED: phosphomevalonate kinase [Lepisosteus oculatus]